MPREQLESIISSLDPIRFPLLVQMPTAEYQRIRGRLELPALKN